MEECYLIKEDFDSTLALRPVINLKPDVKISGGIGTINEPYVVE